MAAYAAVMSLMNTIYNIQNHSRISTLLDKNQIDSLSEKLDCLLDFVENHHSRGGDEEAYGLESQIASAAHAAEDVIESHIVDRIEPLLSRSTFEGEETSSLLLDLLMYLMLSIKNHPGLSTSSLDREQIESLGEKLDFLLDFIENPNSHVSNEETEVLERQIESEARAVDGAISLQKDRFENQGETASTYHLTFSSWLFDFRVVVMEQILNYPRLWTSLESERLKELFKSLDDLDDMVIYLNHLAGLMASEAIVTEDIIEAHEAGSTSDHGETSSSSMTDLQKEINAMKKKVMKVQEKVCQKKVVFAGSGNSFLPDLQKVSENMESLEKKVIKIRAEMVFKDLSLTYSMPAASPYSLPTTGKTSLVGFESYFLQLLDWLTAQQSDLLIIPISGMGGIGKTTLARKVYDDLLVVQHFDVRAWLTVSQVFNVRELLFHTLSRLGETTKELETKTKDELGVLLHKFLYGRRYLIILDDIWSIESWYEISLYFPREENRSRIVVTTRQSDVVNHFGSFSLALNFLDEDKSWDLFCKKAFGQGCCPDELEDIGKKIVEKCQGLPLSIVVIGGLLGKSSRMQEHWENVERDLSSILNSAEDNQCFNILSLSYNYLPAHLKPCFLYLGVFPEDHEISVSRLIQLWAAEGLLNPKKNPSLKRVGKGYMEDLVGRNLILVCGLSTTGKVATCRIHDLLRDLCIKVAEKEKFFSYVRELDAPRDIGRERRLVTPKRIAEELPSTSLVRSVIGEIPYHLTLNSRLLRVFSDACDCSPYTAFSHANLRFFECNPTLSFELTSTISLLWNLQTLIIEGSHVEVVLPSEIWEMEQLKHLQFSGSYLHQPPLSDEEDRIVLRNLETLQTASVFKISDEVCKRLPNIRKLSIFFYDNLWGYEDTLAYYCFYNVCRLTELESLHFNSREVPMYFSLNLRLPSSLKRLALQHCHLKWDELTRIGSLPHLEVLKLDWDSVVGREWNPIEGEFLSLKYLRISKCWDLTKWNADSSHFPVLEKLVLDELTELEEIPSGIGDIPTLGHIELVDCSVSAVMSAISILKEQECYGNEDLQVKVKFWKEDEREEVRKMVELEGFTSHNLQLS